VVLATLLLMMRLGPLWVRVHHRYKEYPSLNWLQKIRGVVL